MVIITSQHVGTYTMAKLTEALGGENSVSEPSQQLRKQQNTQMLNDHTSANTLVTDTQLHSVLILHAVNPPQSTALGCLQQTVH